MNTITNYNEQFYKLADVQENKTYKVKFFPDGDLCIRLFVRQGSRKKFLISPRMVVANNHCELVVLAPISGELMLEDRHQQGWTTLSEIEIEEV